MHVCLINPPNQFELIGNDPVIIKEQQGISPPLGILYIAAYLNNTGRYGVSVIDAQAEDLTHEQVAEKAEQLRPDVVGITAMTFTLIDVKMVMDALRKRLPRNVPIIVGGPHVVIYPEETISALGADYAVVGEGEMTMDSLLQHIASGKNGSQKIWRQESFIQNLDELPFPARELTPIDKYFSVLCKETPTSNAFSCHDEETEVLTSEGFKKWPEINLNDVLLTYEIESGLIKQSKINHFTKNWFDGELIHFKNKTLDIKVTPNHRMLAQFKNEKKWTEPRFEIAELFIQNSTNRRMFCFGEWIGEEPIDQTIRIRTGNHQRTLLDISLKDYLEFLGYYLSEGNSWLLINNRNKPMYRIKITQSLEKNSVTYKKIGDCIDRIGLKSYRCPTQFEISCKDLYEKLHPLGLCDSKYIPDGFKKLTRPYLRILFDSLMEGDGYENKQNGNSVWHYTTTSKKLADDVQEISLKLGYGSTVHKKTECASIGYIRGRPIHSSLSGYTVTVYDRNYRIPYIRKCSKRVPYKGYVYCAETDQGTLITRRGGQVIVSGNSRGCPFACSFCIVGSTQIWMSGDTYKTADSITVGDQIKTLTPDHRRSVDAVVTHVFEPHKQEVLHVECNGTPLSLTATYNHPVLTDKGWKYLHDLSVDDFLIFYDGTLKRVISIEPVGQEMVYNFETSTHTYLSNGFISHNCDRPALGKGFRAMNAKRVVDEMEWCVNKGIKELMFYDDTFSVSKKRVHEICNEVKRRGLSYQDYTGKWKRKIGWDVRTRVNVVDPELLQNMSEAGCERIHFGIESAVPRIIKELSKGITTDQVEDAFALCKKFGIKTLAYFMMGNPTETHEDVDASLQLCRRIEPDFMQMTILSPFPATEIYLRAQREGVIQKDVWREYVRTMSQDFRPPLWEEKFMRPELESQLRWFYKKFYLTPKFVVDRIFEIRSFGQFMRYAKAGLSLLEMSFIPESKLKDSWRTRSAYSKGKMAMAT